MAQLSSGLWTGYYEQWGDRHPQETTLEFADGLIRGDGSDGLGTFTVEGEYRVDGGEVRLGWIKTYDGAHSVLYLGVLDGDRITGEWKLPGGQGSFALSPNRTWET
jgi:hypothetical protein